MKQLIWLITQSIGLDLKMFRNSKLSIFRSLEFIIKKYFLILKHSFVKFKLGESMIKVLGTTVKYESSNGLASYQSMLTRQQHLLDLAKIRECNTAIDIGSNMGFFSKMLRLNFPTATIHAVEPVKPVFECLKFNSAADTNTKVYNLAISDKSGTVTMQFDPQSSLTSHISQAGGVEVATLTLDDFIAQNEIVEIDILKIDTEGFEYHVLSHGQKALEVTKYLMIEITLEENPNYTLSSLMSLLSTDKYNYQLLAFRNYKNTGEGTMPIMDAVLVNVNKK